MFPSNQWYVAAWSGDVVSAPLARTICGEPIVLYRRPNGAVAALEDACPHRLLPLSMGIVEGENIRCKYHGLLLNHAGSCIEMPGGDRANANLRVRNYPIVERYGFIWLWIGDPAAANTADLPDLWMNEAPGWRVGGGTYHVRCDYRLVIDNLMDLTHETLVHASTVGQKELHHFPIETRVEGMRVVTSRWMPGVMPPPLYRDQLGACAGPVDRWQICEFMPPGGVVIDVGVAPVDQGCTLENHESAPIRSFVLDFITPESADTCHYFWGSARNRFLDDDEAFNRITEIQGGVFLEDVEVLEAQQRNIAALGDRRLRSFAIDSGGVKARAILKRLTESTPT